MLIHHDQTTSAAAGKALLRRIIRRLIAKVSGIEQTRNRVELYLEFDSLPSGVSQAQKELDVTPATAKIFTNAVFDNVYQVQITDLADNLTQIRSNEQDWLPLRLAAGHSYRFLITPVVATQSGTLVLISQRSLLHNK